jgi:glycosyltransferase involved in cell wall biosynthesis
VARRAGGRRKELVTGPDSQPAPRIALLLLNEEDGGVERCLINLARGFVARGVRVDLLNRRRGGVFLDDLDPAATLVHLPADTGALHAVARYVDDVHPDILLAAKEEDCDVAGQVPALCERPPACYLVASVNFSAQLAGRRAGPLRRWRRYREVRRTYGRGDNLICVSAGVATDMARILGRDASRFHVLPNPVITPEHAALAAEAIDHPWFAPGQPPVVLGVGRLSRIKNFPLLVRAFARLRAQRACRLVILGEGKHRKRLLALAAELGVSDDMDLPGFVANPVAWMARAALFVLSSRWEGFGNVLVEALACGTPVVSTDCPSGPAEILQAGTYGPLVPVDDEVALSQAMLRCLESPLEADRLRQAAAPYTLDRSCEAYLRAFGVGRLP